MLEQRHDMLSATLDSQWFRVVVVQTIEKMTLFSRVRASRADPPQEQPHHQTLKQTPQFDCEHSTFSCDLMWATLLGNEVPMPVSQAG